MVQERIRETLSSMSPSFQEVGRWMLDNYDSIGFTSVNELSKIIGVSNASLVRYTQALGFSGYKQFKETVQEELRTKLKPDSNVVLNELDVLPIKKKLQKLADNEIQNLSKTLKGLSVQSLSRMVQGVLNSDRIFVSGFGVSKNIMQIFEYALVSMQIKEVHSITGSISDYSARLASMNSSDSLFIMTMPPYSPEALQVANAAHARKVKVYLFTDSAACPIYPIADSVACSANNSLLLTNSFVGMVAVIQVFINMLLLGSDENLIPHMKAVVATEREGYAWLKSQKEVLR
ncbi:MurR/RpiR family transcriptional regulator [uncultured Sphaerochaeta sp.]|uniref:MurR/RpiR family transcriptional regulator n=1 Tax=uncultured Sphaerochaeta sp. TaxID=886478 RepID=UPI0029CA8BAF|nr:MurR/RpiR family transcriptional regulator [uncultured Sphaerochaeta sp.]